MLHAVCGQRESAEYGQATVEVYREEAQLAGEIADLSDISAIKQWGKAIVEISKSYPIKIMAAHIIDSSNAKDAKQFARNIIQYIDQRFGNHFYVAF
jgi:hypothetical protein